MFLVPICTETAYFVVPCWSLVGAWSPPMLTRTPVPPVDH
jgi:hypothetical protein